MKKLFFLLIVLSFYSNIQSGNNPHVPFEPKGKLEQLCDTANMYINNTAQLYVEMTQSMVSAKSDLLVRYKIQCENKDKLEKCLRSLFRAQNSLSQAQKLMTTINSSTRSSYAYNPVRIQKLYDLIAEYNKGTERGILENNLDLAFFYPKYINQALLNTNNNCENFIYIWNIDKSNVSQALELVGHYSKKALKKQQEILNGNNPDPLLQSANSQFNSTLKAKRLQLVGLSTFFHHYFTNKSSNDAIQRDTLESETALELAYPQFIKHAIEASKDSYESAPYTWKVDNKDVLSSLRNASIKLAYALNQHEKMKNNVDLNCVKNVNKYHDHILNKQQKTIDELNSFFLKRLITKKA